MQHELDHLDGVLFPDRVDDPTTLCTWEMFRAYRQDAWVESIEPLLARFPGEPVAAGDRLQPVSGSRRRPRPDTPATG